jgi:class 3 adenylate cyclase
VAYALNRAWFETDLREVLGAVRVPTLVLYRRHPLSAVAAMNVAEAIGGAVAVRLSGSDYGAVYLSPEMPDEIARFVAGEPVTEVPESVLATVLFTDIVDSTQKATALGDRAWREVLARHHSLVRRELARFRGDEKDTAGDGFFATFDGPVRAIRCAQEIVRGVRELGLDVRAGVHTGECELHEGKVAGVAVVIGSRVASLAAGGEVLVSQTVKDLVAGAGLSFADRGAEQLKGVPGEWRLYAVSDA